MRASIVKQAWMTADDPTPSGLLAPIFTSAAMQRIFADPALLQAMLDFEAALARAQAGTGVIPAYAANLISQKCIASLYDIDVIGQASRAAGNPAIPLVKALTAQVAEDARGWVHWGATSQDVIDTALMMQARRGLKLIFADVTATIAAGITLAETHKSSVMAGRTFLQQAVPVTFAFKAANWTAGLVGVRVGLARNLDENIALQFGGAAGTLSALGPDGMAVRAALAAELGLPEPHNSWHSERSRFVEIAAALGVASAVFAKIATDIMLMMQPEVGEAFEPAAAGRGGSSTMPHKRNPIGAAAIRANHRRIAGLVATMLMAAEAEHERGAGGWSAEWQTVSDIFVLAGGSAEHLAEMLAGLEIDPERMRVNLDNARGLPLAESLMMALAPKVGRMKAHHVVEALAKKAIAGGLTLAAVAGAETAVTAHLTQDEIDRALDPQAYLGSANAMIDRVLGEARKQIRGKDGAD
jgi:3-carboxy-cis,cis-muconate cycloisomerase